MSKIENVIKASFGLLDNGAGLLINTYGVIMDCKYYMWYESLRLLKRDICKGRYIGYRDENEYCKISGRFRNKKIFKKFCSKVDIENMRLGNVHHYCLCKEKKCS